MKQQAKCLLAGSAMLVLCLVLPGCSTVPSSQATKHEQQTDVRNMANNTLQQLYGQNPDMQQAVKQSAGYAVFSDIGFKIMFMGGAQGAGVAVNNSKKTTYMKMVELQPGLGLGAERFRVIFLFDTKEALDNFVANGWEAGANAMASAKTNSVDQTSSGAVSVAEGVTMYQITEEGMIVGVSITGARFYKDSDLN